jgi:hypothetical protein
MIYGKFQHILYIEMDETMEFTTHKCHEPRPTVIRKLDSLLVWIDSS